MIAVSQCMANWYVKQDGTDDATAGTTGDPFATADDFASLGSRYIRIEIEYWDPDTETIRWEFINTDTGEEFVIITDENGLLDDNSETSSSDSINYIDIWLPPFYNFRVRTVQTGGVYSGRTTDYFEIQYNKLTSFDKGRLLSGLDIINSEIIYTSSGATIIN